MKALLLALMLLAAPAWAQQGGSAGTTSSSAGGTCAALAGDVTGTCAANTVASIGGKTVTLGGALVTGGALTIADLSTVNSIPYLTSARNLGAFAGCASGVVIFSSGSVPSCNTTLPSGLTVPGATFTTPALGVATATSLAIGGATIGSNALAVTGHLLLEGVTSTGATGTGLLVFGTSPTLTTAVLGSSTATTQSAGDNSTKVATTAYVNAVAGTTGQVPGSDGSTAATAGNVGELLSASATTVSVSNAAAKSVTSISLTAGDWDVFGGVRFNPAGSTAPTFLQVASNTTDNTLPADPDSSIAEIGVSVGVGVRQRFVVGSKPYRVSSTTIVYCIAYAEFTVSTMTADCQLYARRRR